MNFYLQRTLQKIKEMQEATSVHIKYNLLGEYGIILWCYGQLFNQDLRYSFDDEIKNAAVRDYPNLFNEIKKYIK